MWTTLTPHQRFGYAPRSLCTNAGFATNGRVYEFSPHLHTRGARVNYEGLYPAGHKTPTEVLLSVAHYVFLWQTAYRLAHPKDLPAGPKIRVSAGWDNS